MNLTDELERSFGDGPTHRPVEERIVAGRRLVRRRRALAGVAAVAVVAALGAGYAVVAPDGDPARPDVAGQPDDRDDRDDRDDEGRQGVAVDLERDGRLWTAPGVEVLQQVLNPYGFRLPDRSLAVEYEQDGQLHWMVLTRQQDDGQWFSTSERAPAAQALPTFQLWVEVQASEPDHPLLHLVELGADGRLHPRTGVEMVAQVPGVDLGPDAGGENNIVAEVRYDGRRWYVMAGGRGAPAEYQLPAAAEVTEPTLERFVQRLETEPDYFDGLW